MNSYQRAIALAAVFVCALGAQVPTPGGGGGGGAGTVTSVTAGASGGVSVDNTNPAAPKVDIDTSVVPRKAIAEAIPGVWSFSNGLRITVLTGTPTANGLTCNSSAAGWEVGQADALTGRSIWYCDGSNWVQQGANVTGGDMSSVETSSTDGQMIVFNGTTGKSAKKVTSSGIPFLTSGVPSYKTGSAGQYLDMAGNVGAISQYGINTETIRTCALSYGTASSTFTLGGPFHFPNSNAGANTPSGSYTQAFEVYSTSADTVGALCYIIFTSNATYDRWIFAVHTLPINWVSTQPITIAYGFKNAGSGSNNNLTVSLSCGGINGTSYSSTFTTPATVDTVTAAAVANTVFVRSASVSLSSTSCAPGSTVWVKYLNAANAPRLELFYSQLVSKVQ